jgi:hypothetical protein
MNTIDLAQAKYKANAFPGNFNVMSKREDLISEGCRA